MLVSFVVFSLVDVAQAQTAASPQAAPKTVKTQAKAASTPAGPKDPEKFDTSLPVEITSDSLEVLQHENKAIFKGNVVAVQGEVRLKSDTMVVHYKQKSQQDQAVAKTPKPAASPDDQGGMGAITLIEVMGNVFVVTPQESAKGDRGDYDVPTRMLHLFGDNVVLTRDKNIMRGTALEYNMATGRSILTNGSKVVGSPSTGARVRSVFVPNQEPAQNKSSKKSGDNSSSIQN